MAMHKTSLEGALKTKLLLQECHFTWSLREEEDFVLYVLLNRLENQIQFESNKARVTRAYRSLGFVQYLYGHQQEALANLQKSVQLAKEYYKDSDEVLIVTFGDLAWLHYHMNEFSKCEDYLRELERIHRKFSEGFTYIVEVLREKGWTFLKFSYKYYNAAKECFRQALEMKPDDSDLNSGYAIVMFRTANENSESLDSPTIKQLKRAIELDPDDAVLLVLLALRMLRNRDDRMTYETALKKVIVALMMSPENPYVIRYTAKFFRELGNMEHAIACLEKALQATPKSAFIHHELAMCYKGKKKILEKKHRTHSKAEFDVKESDEIQKYLHKCIYHLEMAISLKPSFAIAMADLALHYGQLGRFETEGLFEEAFKRAKNEKRDLQEVHYLFGQYQLYYKRSEQLALHHFMQGLRLQPESEEGKKCENKLKKVIEDRTNRLENLDDGMVCGIQGFIHEIRGEKLKAEEFYERAITNGLDLGKSPLFREIRIWLMSFSETEKSVLNLVFGDHYDEVGSGRLKTFKGAMNEETVHLVDINICNAKRILRWKKPTLGPHVILLAFSLHNDRFTDQTKEILESLEFLGEKFWNHVIVVFTDGDFSVNEYTGDQRSVLDWLLEKCGHKSFNSGSAVETTERIELSESIQRIKRNNSMHLVLPDFSNGDSQSTLDILRKLDMKDCLFTPNVIVQEGQRKYRLQCDHAGWFHCKFTQIGFNMEGEGEVLYSTVLQDSDCPVPANYYQAGPVYDIKCVQGELSQLRLPHCETSIEDACHFISVIHYSGQIADILKPQNITSTHVTVIIPGTSKFLISKVANWFTDHWSKTHGQVMLFYLQRTHRLHVFLQPRSVDPREVENCNKDYKLIQTACECMLKYECVYSMSCDPVEEHGPSLRPVSLIQPADTKLHCPRQWKHYYPTFDIKLPDAVMNVDLHLKKKNPKKGNVKKVVWSRVITLTDYTAENRRASPSTKEQCASFLKDRKVELIQRVRNVDAILDHLGDIIAKEQIDEIRGMNTSQRKTRRIIDIIETQGVLSVQKLLEVLYKEEPALMKDMTTDNN
ncbi:interferon-induced protein with tetratricopeptide repeats 5 [Carassius carassius]|uniref:interferon-induced protein with tetratricopeptide repeats 5 n=1 Tax=Carassius carassius TaxID=217509 RepID=UPI002868495A|nr:interferon-induced protein with tetratricopeptide repeats 5 [Carassius carassius]